MFLLNQLLVAILSLLALRLSLVWPGHAKNYSFDTHHCFDGDGLSLVSGIDLLLRPHLPSLHTCRQMSQGHHVGSAADHRKPALEPFENSESNLPIQVRQELSRLNMGSTTENPPPPPPREGILCDALWHLSQLFNWLNDKFFHTGRESLDLCCSPCRSCCTTSREVSIHLLVFHARDGTHVIAGLSWVFAEGTLPQMGQCNSLAFKTGACWMLRPDSLSAKVCIIVHGTQS